MRWMGRWLLPAAGTTVPGLRSGQSPSNNTVATGTYLQRVPRWWAGKGPATKWKINRSATDLSALSSHFHDNRDFKS
ncbi:hypothetical protein NCPPB1935_08100 [Xanthomonas campestris pv. nigromaculans]|nr:hypothetical protein NCPPB1935_08100 [Xanthomonas campestris pv. nigromaculans]